MSHYWKEPYPGRCQAKVIGQHFNLCKAGTGSSGSSWAWLKQTLYPPETLILNLFGIIPMHTKHPVSPQVSQIHIRLASLPLCYQSQNSLNYAFGWFQFVQLQSYHIRSITVSSIQDNLTDVRSLVGPSGFVAVYLFPKLPPPIMAFCFPTLVISGLFT